MPAFRSIVAPLLATAALAAALPAAALEQGRFRDGLYVAPRELFTVQSPLGPNPHLIDTFDRTTGAVTFLDERGQLYGIVCTPNLDVLAGADNDFETDAAILRNWLREATFPMFFARMIPGSQILREEAVEFEGRPAWVAMIHLPRGSAMIDTDPATGEPVRLDAWRGVVVFMEGGLTYMLMTEAGVDESGRFRTPDADSPEWRGFLPQLTRFYRGMTFEPRPALAEAETPEKTAPEPQRAGT